MTARQVAEAILALPAAQQDLPFHACLAYAPECYIEPVDCLYVQPELTRVEVQDPISGRTVNTWQDTGGYEHVRPSYGST